MLEATTAGDSVSVTENDLDRKTMNSAQAGVSFTIGMLGTT